MSRQILDEARIHPAIRGRITALNADIVKEVQDAVAAHAVVVVGGAEDLARLKHSGELAKMLA